MIHLKDDSEMQLMRESGRLLAQVFEMLNDFIRPGISTLDIDAKVEDFIVNTLHARPASKGQYGFPFTLNTSINEVICHGMPDAHDILKDGDIINCDITLEKNGFIADSSKMYCVGTVSTEAKELIDVTYQALWEGIKVVRPGVKLCEVGRAIQKFIKPRGYSIVRDYTGHGIGREMHEDPHVFHYFEASVDVELREGMTFTIEPMINQGTHKTRSLAQKNGWTVVVTRDQKLSAQWEHTIAVTHDGFEVLTLRDEERRDADNAFMS
ncbi:type I methionyl aminopeptidase [Gynuella sp.]|uniref:type I methionyl aminopeptidase n=1 Tax=Gynuella sp. TaxID=2969146 RepID=UPI003D13E8C6